MKMYVKNADIMEIIVMDIVFFVKIQKMIKMWKLREIKTCWNCKHREKDMSIKPCTECEDLHHDFTIYTKWEPREK